MMIRGEFTGHISAGPGNDIYPQTGSRPAFATLAECSAYCLASIPGCAGAVFDSIPSEQVRSWGVPAMLHWPCLRRIPPPPPLR